MGKKCIPGLICIENMTLFILVVLMILVAYLYYVYIVKLSQSSHETNKIIIINPGNQNMNNQNPSINDPYIPPMKNDALFYPQIVGRTQVQSNSMPGIPINTQTRGLNTNYQQVGILTRNGGHGNTSEMILPLMGRRSMSGRDKWQYYTMSNTGNLNTKLPVSSNGKSCTSENGCDDINNGDMIYVEGYNDTFRVTMYENNLFQYIPFL